VIPYPLALITSQAPTGDILTSYTKLDDVLETRYEEPNVGIRHSYNDRGMLMRIYTIERCRELWTGSSGNALGFIGLIESGNSRFAIEITDVDKAAAFANSTNAEALSKVTKTAQGIRQTNSQHNASLESILGKLFGDGSKGITIYKAEEDKVTFENITN